MLTLLFRKMRSTRWMVLCLFIGFLLAAGMMSTVPIYMDSSLQRILIKDMQAYQQETGEYPGEYVVTKSVPIKADNAQRRSAVQEMTELVDDRTSRIDMPQANKKIIIYDDYMYLTTGKTARVKVIGMTGLEDHVTFIEGGMYAPGHVFCLFFHPSCRLVATGWQSRWLLRRARLHTKMQKRDAVCRKAFFVSLLQRHSASARREITSYRFKYYTAENG